MFSRFSDDARRLVVLAQEEARALGAEQIGTEHLLLGLFHLEDDPASRAIADAGIDQATVLARLADPLDDIDADALAAIGISLDAVRDAVERSFGQDAFRGSTRKNHIPFTGHTKRSFELALRTALQLGGNSIEPGHIALGLLKQDTRAHQILASLTDAQALRHTIMQSLEGPTAASG